MTRARLVAGGLEADFAMRGESAPIKARNRWGSSAPPHRPRSQKLVWCTERRAVVIAFWMVFSTMHTIVGRLMREAWTRYQWETRPRRKP